MGKPSALIWSLATLVAGCYREPSEECRRLLDQQANEEAVLRCRELFESTGDPGAGILAAQAHQRLGHTGEALAWVERLQNTAAEADARRLESEINWRRGDAAGAAAAGRRELLLRHRGEEHARAAETGYYLFYYAWATGDYDEALGFARQSLEDAVRAADQSLEAQALQALYMVLYEVGDLERAERVLKAANRLIAPTQRDERARLQVYEGLIRLNTGRTALARDAFARALELAEDADRSFYRSTHLNLVKANLTLGAVDEAARHLAAAEQYAEPGGGLPIALLYYRACVLHAQGRFAEAAAVTATALAASPDPAWLRDLEYQRGLTEEARGDLVAAEEAYGRAADEVERMRAALGTDELKSWLLEQKRRPFEALFRLQARGGRVGEALATAERARARTLLDALLDISSAAVSDGSDVGGPAGERLAALRELMPPLHRSAAADLAPLDQVLAAIGDRTLVIYVEAADELWRFMVSPSRVDLQRLAATPAEARRLAQRFLAYPDEPGPSAALAEILLPKELPTDPDSTIYVAADGGLATLPFAALRRNGRFLIEYSRVAYVPSLRALAAMLGSSLPEYGPPLVLADPRGDLPGAASEARQVATRLEVLPLLQGDATLAALPRSPQPRILHLATHTGLGPRGPWLALAEGEVTASTVVASGLAPRLVVLAGCASAAHRGREMSGSLGAAFLAAGSPAVLASLWSVEDEATREFILRFYDEGGSAEPAAALARTQRRFIAAGESPSIWAPFVVMGSDGSVEGAS